MANARQIAPAVFQQPHGPEKVEGKRVPGQFVGQIIWRLPSCAGHRMISPRCCVRITVSVKELSETYFAKNCSRAAPRMNTPVPSKAFSSNVTVNSRPRAKAIG